MKKLILFISLIISIAVSAQTYNGNITLSSQQEVDDFVINYPGITSVNGNLTIGTTSGLSNITNLNGIQNLASVNAFFIQYTQLTNITGFSNLNSCQYIHINNNQPLQSITAFNSLNNISYLNIYSNNNLATLNCAQSATLISTLFLGNTQINTFNFPNLQKIGDLYLQNSSNISNFDGFPNLTEISNLYIFNNNNNLQFSNYNFFNNIKSLNLNSCNGIQNINGLHFPPNVNNVSIANSSNLTDLSALNSIVTAKNIFISNLINLQNLNSLSNLFSCDDLIIQYSGNLNDISGLSSLTKTKKLRIYGTQINSTVPLANLVTINGNLEIGANNNLSSLSGLNHQITISGSVTITYNPLLSNCAAQSICNYLGVSSTNATIANNSTGCNSISEVTYACNPVPFTKIRTQDCGLQTTTFNQLYYCNAVSGATKYEYKYRDVATNAVSTWTRTNSIAASLGDAGLLDINRTYSVRVRALLNNVWGNYGDSCLINSPTQVPLTKIRNQDCGLQTTTFNQLFYADAVSYASNYEFEFVDINTNVTTYKVRLNTAASLGDAGLLDINRTYNVRVRAKVGNNWGAFGTICQIKSPITVPETKIRTQDCGLQTTTFNQLFYADIVSYASSYEFEYTDLNTNAITYKVRLNTAASLGDAGLLDINKTYNVRVRAKVGNNWGAFGTICQIKSPITVPETKIRTQDCGLQTTTFTQLYYADLVSYATNYEFEYTDINSGAITYRLRINNAASLNDAGLTQYNKIYDVRVRAKVGNNWGAFGTVCQIKSPINVPVTQINSTYCNLFYTLDGEFSCDPVTNANAYEFEFTNTVTNSITSNIVTTEVNSFFAASLPFYDKIYSVRVRARIGTTWGSYGSSCILKSNGMEFQRLKLGDESSSADSKIESLIKIYPNPTTDILNISDLTESSTINVFNVSGQLVLTKSSVESNEKIDLSYLDNGIYMIVIEGKNGEIAKRQRIVLAK
jgi:hypothetical protein